MTIQNKLESVKDRKSYSSPAKRTMEKLKPILSKSEELSDRWVWELLQNASDLGESISVQFRISDDKLKFSHNGKNFNLEEAFNLIMPDSNKDEEGNVDETDDMIGQFGTGFISTHVLSSRITVKGIVEDNSDNYRFEFCLDRSNRTEKSSLIASIKESESQYRNSLVSISKDDLVEFGTEFIYDLSSSYEGLNSTEILNRGLSTLELLLPYVLVFRKQITKVEVYDDRDSLNNYKCYSTLKTSDKIDGCDLYETLVTDEAKEIVNRKIIVVVGNGDVQVACPVRKIEETKYLIEPFAKSFPKIYCAFPMIGSDSNLFPIIVNSKYFEPNTERNGIEISEHDLKNRKLLIEASVAFNSFIDIVEKHRWDGGFNLFKFQSIDFGNAKSNNWYKSNLFNGLIYKLRSSKIIKEDTKVDTRYLSISSMYIPYYDRREKDSKEQLIKIHEFGSGLLAYALPDSKMLLDWYENIDYELYKVSTLDYKEIAKVLARDSNSLSTLRKKEEIDSERVDLLSKFIKYIIDKDEEGLLNKFKIIPNQNEKLCFLKDLSIDLISHKLIEYSDITRLKILGKEICSGDVKDRLVHEGFQSTIENLISDNTISLSDFCREVDDAVKEYKGDYRDTKFVTILKQLFSWLNTVGLSEDLVSKLFPYFSKEKSQLYLNTKSSEELEYAFDIDISGKSKALSELAKSSLSAEDIATIASNSKAVLSFIRWVSKKGEDNPDEELGGLGENFLNAELCEIFGPERVKWENKREYDFRILNKDLTTTKYYIDAKTTMKNLGNTENVPFYMRKAQWQFLETENAFGKYVIARLEKYNNDYKVKYLKIGIESVK